MMASGLLWYDDDIRRPLALKVAEAAQRYRERVGYEPTTCQLNPALIPAPTSAAPRRSRKGADLPTIALRLEANEHLRPHYFYVGVLEGERLKRAVDPVVAAKAAAKKAEKAEKAERASKTASANSTIEDIQCAKKNEIAAKTARVDDTLSQSATPKRAKKPEKIAAHAPVEVAQPAPTIEQAIESPKKNIAAKTATKLTKASATTTASSKWPSKMDLRRATVWGWDSVAASAWSMSSRSTPRPERVPASQSFDGSSLYRVDSDHG